jgi:NAD(P)-dependent dehydrogenase (short-subunit alcohol dehydrogenase family)
MSSVSIELSKQIVLICGGGGVGIGHRTTRAVSLTGATVVVVERTQALLDVVVGEIEGTGGKISGIVADLTDNTMSGTIIAEVLKRHGRLDSVINVAGGTKTHQWMNLEDTPDSIYREVFGLNLDYVFRICRDAAKWIIQSGRSGAFVNVASMSALNSAPYHGPYGAAKAGMIALTRTMAIEWNRYGIRSNCVSPGAVLTERVKQQLSKSMSPGTANIAGRQIVDPEEIAKTCVFLISDLASGVSGQNIVVDIGLTQSFTAAPLESMQRLRVS